MYNFVIYMALAGLLVVNTTAFLSPAKYQSIDPQTIESSQTCTDLNYEPHQEKASLTSNNVRVYRLHSGELCQVRNHNPNWLAP